MYSGIRCFSPGELKATYHIHLWTRGGVGGTQSSTVRKRIVLCVTLVIFDTVHTFYIATPGKMLGRFGPVPPLP